LNVPFLHHQEKEIYALWLESHKTCTEKIVKEKKTTPKKESLMDLYFKNKEKGKNEL
jgi:hypothetical protein